jgi:hypothetical protein
MFFVSGEPPVSQRDRASHHGYIKEYCRSAVGDSLRARTGSLRCSNKPDRALLQTWLARDLDVGWACACDLDVPFDPS